MMRMSEGSERKPGEGGAGTQDRAFDDVWDALVERGSKRVSAHEDAPTRDGAHDATEPPATAARTNLPSSGPGPSAATKVWDDAARAEGLISPSKATVAAPSSTTAATKPWDEAARAAAKPPAARPDVDATMEALMAEAEATKRSSATTSAEDEAPVPEPVEAHGTTRPPWLERSDEWLERSDDEMARIMMASPAELTPVLANHSAGGETPASREKPAVPPESPPKDGRRDDSVDRDVDGASGATVEAKSSDPDHERRDDSERSAIDEDVGTTIGATQDDQRRDDSNRSDADEDVGATVEAASDDQGDGRRDDSERSDLDEEPADAGGRSAPDAREEVEPSSPPAPPEAGAGKGRLWILLVAIFGLFGLWALLPEPAHRPVVPTLDADRPGVPVGPAAEHPGGPPEPGPRSPDASPMIERPPHAVEAAEADEADEAVQTEEADETVQTEEAEPREPETPSEDDETAIEPRVDLRLPPAGTAPEYAEAFRRLPVGPGDGPPVGGVGKGGTHIDQISLGSAYGRGGCEGKLDDFSVSERDRVNVCVRVVHPREKEELVVLWQKDGDTIRRGKLTIVPQHAYRTRAYLMLRGHYVGQWVVRIFSRDGVELAAHEFQVVQ
jgi:hypothetical protein